MNIEKINFRQARDFGETFNVSVKFLRQNFKLFFQSLILIAGPFILINAVSGALYQSQSINFISVMRFAQNNPMNPFAMYGWSFLLFILTAILANLALVGTTIAFMINYMEKGPNGFTVNDVGRTLVKNIGNIFAVFFTFLILMVLIILVIAGIMVAIASFIPVLAIILGIGLFFGLLIIIPPLMWQLSATYLVKMQEGRSVFNSFGRTREVMRSNFWWTWAIVFCASGAIAILGFVFALPQGIYQVILMFTSLKGGGVGTSIPFLIVSTVCTFCSTLLYSILYVINSFHYYSLAEQKDGTGLIERINEIGNIPNNNVDQQY